jgi:hypothetical protein
VSFVMSTGPGAAVLYTRISCLKRSVTISPPNHREVRDRLVDRVELKTEKHRYVVDVSAVADDELADALRVLTRMIRGVALLTQA